MANILNDPAVLLHPPLTFYIGRRNDSYRLRDSPLANAHGLFDKRDRNERNRVCNAHIDDLIVVLEKQTGKQWEELKRLALIMRSGKNITLFCWCAPERCHGEAVGVALRGLAQQWGIKEISNRLRSMKTEVTEQISLI